MCDSIPQFSNLRSCSWSEATSREATFQSDCGVLIDRANLEGELLKRMLGTLAVVEPGLRHVQDFVRTAAGAADNTIGPANRNHVLTAVLTV